jgi:hypothetical protein
MYKINNSHGINVKLYIERRILIDLIKTYEKFFNQEKLSFENAVINIIESKLRDILGDNVFQAIKNYLEENFSLKLVDAIKKPEEFFDALEKIFGKSVCTIEKLILKDIQEKLKR